VLCCAARRSEEARAFATQLADAYRAVGAAGTPFQVVFVSSDRSVDAFASFLGARVGLSRACRRGAWARGGAQAQQPHSLR
jgi:hypothetical protein